MAKTSVLVIATPTRLAPGLHEGGVHACSPHAGAEYGAFNWEPQLHRQLAVDLRATYSISTCFLSYKMDTTKGLSYSPAFASSVPVLVEDRRVSFWEEGGLKISVCQGFSSLSTRPSHRIKAIREARVAQKTLSWKGPSLIPCHF